MNNQYEKMIGMQLEPFTYKVELSKVRELALAIDKNQSSLQKEDDIPPTFPTVIDYWGSPYSIFDFLGLNLEKTLHGEQEFEYFGKIKVGDDITVHGEIEDTYSKSAMNFIVIKQRFVNQEGETVVIGRSTLIEKQ